MEKISVVGLPNFSSVSSLIDLVLHPIVSDFI